MKIKLTSLNQLRFIFLSLLVALALVSCGGGSSDASSGTEEENSNLEGSDSAGEQVDEMDVESTENSGNAEANVLIGVFIDSPVEGLSYSTETQSGTTNSAGEFTYLSGENVTFSIGTLDFPTVPAATQITPVDLAENSPSPSATITNIAVLLQSLDEDSNSSNGITISESAAASAAPIDLNAEVDQFASDAAVINLVANSGSTTTMLISADAANQHLLESIGFDNTAANNTNGDGSNDTGISDSSDVEPPSSTASESGISTYTYEADGLLAYEENGNFVFEETALDVTIRTLDGTQFDLLDGKVVVNQPSCFVVSVEGNSESEFSEYGSVEMIAESTSIMLSGPTFDVFEYVSFYSGREGFTVAGTPLNSPNQFRIEVDDTNAFCYQVPATFYVTYIRHPGGEAY